MKRRMLALLTAMLLILGAPLQVLAATHDVSDFEGVENAFLTDTDEEVTVNLTNNITWEYSLGVNEGQNYTVNGNGNDIAGNVGFYGDADVTVNADIVDGSLTAMDGADVTLNGDISGDSGIYVYDSSATVNGDVTIEAEEGQGYIETYEGELTVNGDVSTTNGIGASDATVVIDGNVKADGYVNAYNSDFSVSGDVAATNVGADNADLAIVGNLTGEYLSGYNSDMTVDGNVDAENVYVDESSTLSIEGNVTASNVTAWNSDLTIVGDVDAFVYAESSSVTVNGDINGEHVGAFHSDMTINGDVTTEHGVYAEESDVTIVGDVTATQGDAVTVVGGTVAIEGDVTGGSDIVSENPTTGEIVTFSGVGIAAVDSTVTVKGNVTSGDVHSAPGACQPAVVAQNANVKITGNVTAGSVILASEPADDAVMQGGIGVAVLGSAVVEVTGNVTGGSIPAGYVSEENGICGVAVYYAEDDSNPFTGKVTVHGFLADGNSDYGAKNAAPVVTISPVSGSDDAEISIDVSVSGNEVVIKEMKADELEALLDALKKTIKENDEGVTIDISACKDADTIRIPVELLKAIIENFGKLEIIFDGGVVTIDAAAFEKLVAENDFVTISLK